MSMLSGTKMFIVRERDKNIKSRKLGKIPEILKFNQKKPNNDQSNSNKHSNHPSCGLEMPFTTKMNQGFLEKHQIPDLGQEINKMNLEYLVIPESKDIKDYWNHIKRALELIWRDFHSPKMGQYTFQIYITAMDWSTPNVLKSMSS